MSKELSHFEQSCPVCGCPELGVQLWACPLLYLFPEGPVVTGGENRELGDLFWQPAFPLSEFRWWDRGTCSHLTRRGSACGGLLPGACQSLGFRQPPARPGALLLCACLCSCDRRLAEEWSRRDLADALQVLLVSCSS